MSLVGFTRIAEYELPVITGSHDDFVVLLKYADFTTATLAKLDDGGGDLRFSSDEAGVTQLPCEVVSFDKVGNSAQVWVKVPSAYTGAIIHVWGDNAGASQPSVTDNYGRDAVWSESNAVWHMESLQPSDSSGNGFDGTSTNSKSVSTGVIGGAIHSTSASGKVLISNGEIVNSNQPFTIAGWINLNSITTGSSIIYRINSDLSQAYQLFEINNASYGVLNFGSNAGWVKFGVDPPVTMGQWAHVCVTYNGLGSTALSNFDVYFNGVVQAKKSNAAVGVVSKFNVFTATASGAGSMDGAIDSHRVDARNLSDDYILAEYSNQSAVGSWGVMTDVASSGEITGDVNLTLSEPEFTLAGSATIPEPTGSIEFTVDNPVFSVSGDATLPKPVGNIDLSIGKPSFSLSGDATLPNPIGNASFNIGKPSFTASGSVTIPYPQGVIDFNLNAPLFSVSGEATQPNPNGNIALTLSAPVFSVDGSASLPQPTGAVNTELSAPTFALTGSVTIPTWSANGNVTLNKPLFSVTGSTTLPQPNGSVELNLTSPVFNVSGSASGIVIINGTDSTITLEAKVNLLTLETKSNTITL